MSPQRARRSAGNAVLALVERLSDDLLVEEQAAFVGIEVPFGQRQADVDAVIVSTLKRHGLDGLNEDGDWLARLSSMCGEAILACDQAVLALHERAWDLTRESVQDQLLICEASAAKRMSGIALDGCASADEVRADLLSEATRGWAEGRVSALQTLGYEVARQIDMAVLYDKASPDRTLGRFTSPDALHIQGCSGRGAWWRPVATLQRYARESAIALSNRITSVAVTGMNESAAARG